MKCLQCGKELVKWQKKFCSHSCSATYNNRGKNRHGTQVGNCKFCNKRLNESKKKYCSSTCQQLQQRYEYIYKWKLGLKNGMSGEYGVSSYIRNYLFDRYNNSCQLCNWSVINMFTNKVPLEIHHIDGDYTNNKLNNLQLLCPNCHALTNTYNGANTGNGNKLRPIGSRR